MPRPRQNSISVPEYGRLLETVLERAASYARSLLRNRHDAEDALQQAALRGLERLDTYDPGRPFKAWWFAVLRNCCIDVLRTRRVPTVSIEGVDPAYRPTHERQDWEELALALQRIGPEHGEILRLRYFGQLSYRELAGALDIPEGTVMSRLHYARKALAKEMEKHEP